MRAIVIMLLVLLLSPVFSQKKKGKKNAPPTTVEPYYPQREYGPKDEGKKKKGLTYEAQARYQDRVRALQKIQIVREENRAKAQSTNPLYFGHRRPPKKRPPEKMKFCKVCQIRH
jgi:hypothetical protein